MYSGSMLLAMVGLVTTVAILFWPNRTVALLLLFAPVIWGFGAADINSHEVGAPNIAVVVSGVATLMYARFLIRPLSTPVLRWLQIATLVYCLAILPSVFVSASSAQSFRGYLRMISPVVMMFAVLHCSRPLGVSALHFKAIALATACILSVVLLAQYTGDGSLLMGGFERLRAFNLSPQHVSQYSVAGVGVLVCGVLLSKRRYVYVTGILALMACTYLTGLRTAWVGMAVLIGLVMIIAVRSGLAKFLALLTGLGLLAAGGMIIQSLTRYARSDEAVSVDMLNAITSGRITTDSIALERYLAGTPAEWLFGIGVYSSEEATYEGEGTGYGVHSDFLGTLIECGILGLLAYSLFLFTTGWALLDMMHHLPRVDPGRTFAAVAFATFVAFTIMGIPGALYTNVFVGWYYYSFIAVALAQSHKGSFESTSVRRDLLQQSSRVPAFYGKNSPA